MDLGLPSDKLSNAELQEWLIERIDAKTKAATALQDTAAYLSATKRYYKFLLY